MRRDRRRSDPLPMRPGDEPPPSRWERVEVYLEFGGYSILVLAALLASAENAISLFKSLL